MTVPMNQSNSVCVTWARLALSRKTRSWLCAKSARCSMVGCARVVSPRRTSIVIHTCACACSEPLFPFACSPQHHGPMRCGTFWRTLSHIFYVNNRNVATSFIILLVRDVFVLQAMATAYYRLAYELGGVAVGNDLRP